MPKELAIGSIVYSCTFFKEINCGGIFYVQGHCQHDLLYRVLHPELFLYRSQCVSSSMNCIFNPGSWWQISIQPFWKHILTKTCFLIQIKHSSVNFTLFALFSNQTFDDRPLFKPGVLWFTGILNSLRTNIFTRLGFAVNQFQTLTLKKDEKNVFFFFLKHWLHLLNDPRIFKERLTHNYEHKAIASQINLTTTTTTSMRPSERPDLVIQTASLIFFSRQKPVKVGYIKCMRWHKTTQSETCHRRKFINAVCNFRPLRLQCIFTSIYKSCGWESVNLFRYQTIFAFHQIKTDCSEQNYY